MNMRLEINCRQEFPRENSHTYQNQ